MKQKCLTIFQIKLISILIFCPLTIVDLLSQNCSCDGLFLQTKQLVEVNYAGFFDKVNDFSRVKYDNWTQKSQALVKAEVNDSLCAKQLQDWISFFNDKHLRVKYIEPKVPLSSNKVISKELKILTTNLSERDILNYFSNNNELDPVEGIYKSNSYTLGVTKVANDLFYATIISTTNENWKEGEVKLVIRKSNENYSGTFYEGDKSDVSSHDVKLVDNILDFDIVFYEKTFPITKVIRDINEYEMTKDKHAPSFEIKDDSFAIFTFPSFENNSFEQTEYLLNKYKNELGKIPYWIIDLRNNSGGDYQVGMQLLKYIYTKPIVNYNVEMRMTPQNFEIWYNSYIKDSYEDSNDADKKEYDDYFALMKMNYGKMFNADGKISDTIIMDNVLPFPVKIGILINENTVSSGELFTMAARQSEKVTVFGQNSGGMMDYGNIVNYKTTCPTFKIQLPMVRQLWLDDGISVDEKGLSPDVYLSDGNWIKEAELFISSKN